MRAALLGLVLLAPGVGWAGLEAPVHRSGVLVEVDPHSVAAGYLWEGTPFPTWVAITFDPAILTLHLSGGAHRVLGMRGPRWISASPQVGGVLALADGPAAGLEGAFSLDLGHLRTHTITWVGGQVGGTYLAGEAGGGHMDVTGHVGVMVPVGDHDLWIQGGGGRLWGGQGQGELLFTTQVGIHFGLEGINKGHKVHQTR